MLLRLSCSMCCARALEGLVRVGSSALGRGRVREREAVEERQVGRERRPGAACGLDSYVSPSPLPRHARRAATLFMIASELEVSSRFSSTNNNSFFLSRHFIFFESTVSFNSFTCNIAMKLQSIFITFKANTLPVNVYLFTKRRICQRVLRGRQPLIKQYATFTDLRKQTTQSFRRRAA